jgi:hypothetical protein
MHTNEIHLKNFAIHRMKAKIHMSDGTISIVQGVREVFEISAGTTQHDSNSESRLKSCGKIVLIGRHLDNSIKLV